MQSGSRTLPFKQILSGSSPDSFANEALVVEQADTLRSDRSDASRAGANPAEGTNYVAEGEVDSPRAVTPL